MMEVKYESPKRRVWWPLYDLKSGPELAEDDAWSEGLDKDALKSSRRMSLPMVAAAQRLHAFGREV